MTVLARYERLECPGVWRADAASRRVNVQVSLGESTLIIRDQAEIALAHWSLPAVERMADGGEPLFRPGEDSEERLELSDPTMIEAIDVIRRSVSRGQPHPGRLRIGLSAIVLAAGLAMGFLWLPGAVIRHIADALPSPARAELGARLLVALEPMAGRACSSAEGDRAAQGLVGRLFGADGRQLVVLPGGAARVVEVPGGRIVAPQAIVRGASGPEAFGGRMISAAARAELADPVEALLRDAGLRAALAMLTTGRLTEAALARHARTILAADPPALPDDAILQRFADARLSIAPYAREADPDGSTMLMARDPYPNGSPEPVLGTSAWRSLQSICEPRGATQQHG